MSNHTTHVIHNGQDIIDSRDVIARFDELESERESALDNVREGAIHADADDWTIPGTDDKPERVWSDDWNEEQETEYQSLRKLCEEGEHATSDWRHGEAMIRDSYFETYAQELADDLGLMNDTNKWPYTCIDWERAARELRMDYSSIDFAGTTYWVRS